MYTMATCHGGTRYPIDRYINFYIEDPEARGRDNDNENISGLDAIVALVGLEAEGNPMLTALTWTINELCQQVEAGEGQQAERLDCIEWEL